MKIIIPLDRASNSLSFYLLLYVLESPLQLFNEAQSRPQLSRSMISFVSRNNCKIL